MLQSFILASHFILIYTVYSEHKSNASHSPTIYQEFTIFQERKKRKKKTYTGHCTAPGLSMDTVKIPPFVVEVRHLGLKFFLKSL